MPGQFSKDARPQRPGAYFDWATNAPANILPNLGSVVFLPFTHDWGPVNSVVPLKSFAEFTAAYGPTTTTTGYRAVKQCFEGEGLSGRGGAGTVLAYRVAASSAAASTLALANTTPATAITLTAKYKGTYGANIAVVTHVNALDATKTDLILSVSGNVVETYTFLSTDIVALAALINAQSNWVTAVEAITGTALADHTPTPEALSAGANGATLTSTEWGNTLDDAETERFSLFAPFEMVDAGITSTIAAWAIALNANGKRFLTLFGGALNDTASAAVSRSAGLNDPNILNLGVGGVVDDEFGNLSTSMLVPRIAGILAARGETMSLTYARLKGTSAYNFPIEADILKAFTGGVIVLGQDSHPDAPVRIEKGITTYTTINDANRPYLIYRNPKFVRTMHGIESDITEWAAFNAVGQLQVNATSRTYLVGHAKDLIKARADLGVIQQGYSVGIDPSPPPSDSDEFVALIYGVAFGRSMEQVFNLVYVS